MYLGSAAAMLVLPSVSAAFGPASLLRLVGLLGLTWLLLWLAVGQEIPHRCVQEGGLPVGGRQGECDWLAGLVDACLSGDRGRGGHVAKEETSGTAMLQLYFNGYLFRAHVS